MIENDEPPQYDLVISLGYSCACAYQIRLHTRISEAYFFDWLYSSAPAVTATLNSGFEGILNSPKKCPIVRDGQEVLDTPTGLRFNHSFKIGPKISPELYIRDFTRESEKYAHLGRKTLAAMSSSSKALFIRWCPYPDRADSIEETDALRQALSRRCRSFDLWTVINSEAPKAADPRGANLIWLPNDPERSVSYHGGSFIGSDDIAWKTLLNRVAVDPGHQRVLMPGEPVLNTRVALYD